MRYLGLGVLIYAFISISGFLFVTLTLISFYIKKKVCKMDKTKWDLYFKSMNNYDYLIRFWLVYIVSLIMISGFEYYILISFNFENALFLSVLTIILGIMKTIFKFKSEMNKLLEKIDKIRNL